VPHYPYFMAEPIKSSAGLDYYSNEIYGREVVYWYHHTLSGIMQAIIDSGLTIRRFQEFEHDSDSGYARVRAFRRGTDELSAERNKIAIDWRLARARVIDPRAQHALARSGCLLAIGCTATGQR